MHCSLGSLTVSVFSSICLLLSLSRSLGLSVSLSLSHTHSLSLSLSHPLSLSLSPTHSRPPFALTLSQCLNTCQHSHAAVSNIASSFATPQASFEPQSISSKNLRAAASALCKHVGLCWPGVSLQTEQQWICGGITLRSHVVQTRTGSSATIAALILEHFLLCRLFCRQPRQQ